MSQCVFTENVLVTIGMFCDDWFQHKFAQVLIVHVHILCDKCSKHHFTSSIFVSHCGGEDARS